MFYVLFNKDRTKGQAQIQTQAMRQQQEQRETIQMHVAQRGGRHRERSGECEFSSLLIRKLFVSIV